MARGAEVRAAKADVARARAAVAALPHVERGVAGVAALARGARRAGGAQAVVGRELGIIRDVGAAHRAAEVRIAAQGAQVEGVGAAAVGEGGGLGEGDVVGAQLPADQGVDLRQHGVVRGRERREGRMRADGLALGAAATREEETARWGRGERCELLVKAGQMVDVAAG